MKKSILITTTILFSCIIIQSSIAGTHSLGIGFHYFRALDDIRSDLEDDFGDAFNEDGLAINVSYIYNPNKLFGLICEVQTFPNGYLDADNAISPRVLVVLGDSFYAGGGIAWNYTNWSDITADLHESENWSDPYYLLRGGVNLPFFIPALKLDINASYEFNEWNDVEYFNSDIITFGAILRFKII